MVCAVIHGAAEADRRQREQGAAGWADLDCGAHLWADAAVEARRPSAVVHLDLSQSVLPVLPEPVAVQPSVEVIPGQDFGVLALAGRVPVEVDDVAGQCRRRRGDPAVVGEVLAPPVEAAAVLPGRADDPANSAIAAGEQSFDLAGLAVVVAEPDRPGVPAVAADGFAQLGQPGVNGLVVALRRPLERRVRLGHERADRHRAPDVAMSGDLAPSVDDLLGQVGNREHVLVGLGGQPAHEVELHLPPAVAVRRRDRAQQVVLADHLVDDPSHPLGAAFGGEGQPERRPLRDSSLARVTLKASTRVDGSESETLLSSYRSASPEVISDLGVVGTGQRQQAHLFESRALRPVLTMSPIVVIDRSGPVG